MSRRMSLPGADELFRTTGGIGEPARDASAPADAEPPVEPLRAVPDEQPHRPVRRPAAGERRPSGRERHDEKITVYVSAAELMDLEHARLTLRGEHGTAVDRGRIVREALAWVIEDLEANGDASILVQRLRQQSDQQRGR